MKVDKRDAQIIREAIDTWENDQTVSPELGDKLRNSIEVQSSGSKTITWYLFIGAVSCGLLAFGALVLDEKWIELLRKDWGLSEATVGILFAALSGILIYLSSRRNKTTPATQIGNETYNLTIVLSLAIAITYFTRALGNTQNYALPLLIGAAIYATVACLLQSKLIWIAALIAITGWWGAQTHLWADTQFQFFGMNYPLRMTLFGLSIWAAAFSTRKSRFTQKFESITHLTGLLLFMIALWTLSIFGNYDDLDRWSAVKQATLWYWALGYTVVLTGITAYAFLRDLDLLRDVSLGFFILNIYTRYFEYFWDRTNKGLFFAILAVSFWFVGKKAEQWLNRSDKNATSKV